MLIQFLIDARTDQRAEAVQRFSISVDAAGADLDDLMGHAMVCMKTALVPFQIEYNQILIFLI